MTKIPKAPAELKASGRRLWREVQERYELEEHERGLLLEMCRTVDMLDTLAALVADEGPTVVDHTGNTRVHPALVEARQLRIAYARLAAALRLPAGEEDEGVTRRPQRRVGVRGVYGPRGVA
ncbi:P27 family phage terminase small subunit [Actinomadura fibrosa]|uniref:P27 family phage terminase small subunit n=1 Tax=Actinomadura fibrosa TaxID=111802 RepID=A0ABW2XJU9_9ACTN|nr:P27 family phage terminase small subunit [Actinomadura fibrosa]